MRKKSLANGKMMRILSAVDKWMVTAKKGSFEPFVCIFICMRLYKYVSLYIDGCTRARNEYERFTNASLLPEIN